MNQRQQQTSHADPKPKAETPRTFRAKTIKAKNVQLVSAIVLLIVGVVLLFIGEFAPPVGVIDNSNLVAFGEILTFAGSVFGIDYNYRFKMTKLNFDNRQEGG